MIMQSSLGIVFLILAIWDIAREDNSYWRATHIEACCMSIAINFAGIVCYQGDEYGLDQPAAAAENTEVKSFLPCACVHNRWAQ